MTPLRVLVASPAFAPQLGGAETWTRSVFGRLARRGHAVDVLARAAPSAERAHAIDAMNVERVGGSRAAFARAVGAQALARNHDVVVAQYAALPFALAASRRSRVPVVAIVHDVYGWRESWRIKGVGRGTQRRVALESTVRLLRPAAVLTPSRATATRVQSLLPGTAVHAVPAGADHLPLRHRDVARRDDMVVFVGRLVHQKGIFDLIEATAEMQRTRADLTLVVVGRGPAAEEARARAAALDARVEFADNVSDDDLDRLLSEAAVVALPSTREGWGLAVTEAAARGTPYVAYDIPAVREQHELLRGGVLVAPHPTALQQGLQQVLDDPTVARRAAADAAGRAVTLTWDTSAAVVEQVLRDVAAQQG